MILKNHIISIHMWLSIPKFKPEVGKPFFLHASGRFSFPFLSMQTHRFSPLHFNRSFAHTYLCISTHSISLFLIHTLRLFSSHDLPSWLVGKLNNTLICALASCSPQHWDVALKAHCYPTMWTNCHHMYNKKPQKGVVWQAIIPNLQKTH